MRLPTCFCFFCIVLVTLVFALPSFYTEHWIWSCIDKRRKSWESTASHMPIFCFVHYVYLVIIFMWRYCLPFSYTRLDRIKLNLTKPFSIESLDRSSPFDPHSLFCPGILQLEPHDYYISLWRSQWALLFISVALATLIYTKNSVGNTLRMVAWHLTCFDPVYRTLLSAFEFEFLLFLFWFAWCRRTLWSASK